MDVATVERFEANRDRLASVAYRLLGSAADAEDVVQDAFLRWRTADHGRIDVPEAWLTKIATNLAIDRLRSAKMRHERAVGTWLPEPLLDGDPMLGPAETVEQRESVTLAVLTIMERLTPVERAVYVLREAFSHSHREIAEILEITESASQQHALRARRRIAAERTSNTVDAAAARQIVAAFVAAASSGDTQRLLALLTDDVTATTDGAGLAKRLLHFSGPRRIAIIVRAAFRDSPTRREQIGSAPTAYAHLVNGSPAMIAVVDDRVVGMAMLDMHGDKIGAVRAMAAPDKLERITARWQQQSHDDPVSVAW